jgi:hypothetical protein
MPCGSADQLFEQAGQRIMRTRPPTKFSIVATGRLQDGQRRPVIGGSVRSGASSSMWIAASLTAAAKSAIGEIP